MLVIWNERARPLRVRCGAVRAQLARDLLDEGGLAGAVGPDYRVRFALAHVEIHAVRGNQRAEGLPQLAGFKEAIHFFRASGPPVRAWRRSRPARGTGPGR